MDCTCVFFGGTLRHSRQPSSISDWIKGRTWTTTRTEHSSDVSAFVLVGNVNDDVLGGDCVLLGSRVLVRDGERGGEGGGGVLTPVCVLLLNGDFFLASDVDIRLQKKLEPLSKTKKQNGGFTNTG